MRLFAKVLDILFPKACLGCQVQGVYLCQPCASQIKYFKFPLCPGCGKYITSVGVHPFCKHSTQLDGLFALGVHEGILRVLVKQIKYYGHFDMVGTAASLLASQLPASLKTTEIITAVPMHGEQKRQRGYNQSELLAICLSQYIQVPYQPVLIKFRLTPKQAGLKRQARLENLTNAFAVRQDTNMPRSVLLVDDVTTTRATLNECAKVLKKAGVKKVYGAVLAHGK